MCDNIKNSSNTAEVNCDCKSICQKMRDAGLRQAATTLSSNTDNTRIIVDTLSTIINILESYSCLPCRLIMRRTEYTLRNMQVGVGPLYPHESTRISILVEEINAFLDS